jgi:glutamyl-tRNA synthetase
MKDFEKKARGYALKNALIHGGKASVGSVISALFNEGLKKEDMKEKGNEINEIVNSVNELSFDEQEKEFESLKDILSERKVREGLPELPNAEKGVVMRGAPSASGPMHILHGISYSLSYDYFKKYGGKMIIRVEDTNPKNVDPKAYRLIEDETKWLFEGEVGFYIQSDRMDLYYKYAEDLIEKGFAYVCSCTSEEFKTKYSELKENCPCRNNEVKENQMRWKKMRSKEKDSYKEGEVVLRFKTPGEGMKHKNPAMRDFPLARINETKHPRQGNKYRVWPLMNLCVSVDDIEMKMTHIIRGKDHRDNAERQKMIFDVFGKKYPWTYFLGRYHFLDMPLSTTQFRKGIEEGKYSGWDDPKLPTLASLKKRGYKPQAFWKMAEHIGLSEVDKKISKEDFFKVFNKFNEEKWAMSGV